jgi:hypothetical protein
MSIVKLTRPMKYRVQPTPAMEERAREWLAQTVLKPDEKAVAELRRDLGVILAGAASRSCGRRNVNSALGRAGINRYHHTGMAFAA